MTYYHTQETCSVCHQNEDVMRNINGFAYQGISNRKGSKRPTVESFAKNHKQGNYLVNVANHVVAISNGCYYDTWDSGDCCLYGYYYKEEGEK